MSANSVYARLDDLVAKFDILSEDKYFERLVPGNGESDVMNKADRRNHYKCKFCDLDNLPSQDKDISITLTHYNIKSLSAHYDELETTVDAIGTPSVIGPTET